MATPLSSLLMKEQPLRTGAMACYPASDALRKKFTVTSTYDETLPLYRESANGKHLFVPRAVCPLGEQDTRTDGTSLEYENPSLLLPPKDEQQLEVCDAMIDLLQKGESFGIRAPTGRGKTYMGCVAAVAMKRRTLIVVPKSDLVDQWLVSIEKFTDFPKSSIGFVRQDHYNIVDKDIVVGMLHSLAIPERYPSWLYKQFGLIVFDEQHRLAAETFNRVCGIFPARLRLGLSAMEKRKDGMEVAFLANIGPVRIEMEGVAMQPRVFRYRTDFTLPKVYDKQKGRVRTIRHSPGKMGHVLNLMADDPNRNALIASVIHACWMADRSTVIFSDRIDHLKKLRALAITLGVDGGDTGFFVHGVSKQEAKIAQAKPLCFSTYGMGGEGTDVPWWDCLVQATPRSDARQSVGRILREYPEKKQPVVHDFIDHKVHVYQAFADKRWDYYKSIGASVEWADAD